MIEIATLGGLRVFRDGAELASLPAKPLRVTMLVYLAIEREASRERICLLFWPESSPERARHALSQTLYELRRVLGNGWMESIGDRVIATDELSSDVSSLLDAADDGRHLDVVEAYAGPFLDGVPLSGGVELERWVEEKRTALHGRARRAFRSVVDHASDLDERIRLARGWVQLDPLDDEGQHALIEGLGLVGDRVAALEQYRVYSDLLEAELELEPLDHTRELVERIKDDTSAPGPLPAKTSGTEVASLQPSSGVGRDLDSLDLATNLRPSRLIGRGTTGSVYLAREPALRRLVAVKVLDPDLSRNPTARARFEREAQSAARIVHPNVATVHQLGTTRDDRPYLVMPYVKGGTLADRMKAHGPLPPSEVRRLLAESASALAAAHAVGVIHRDVRPANILYDERTERTYLADFGVAGVLESGDEELARLTRSGELLGNAEYVSPEQGRGDDVDDRSDVYSLGVLGRVLLFGRPTAPRELPADWPDPELLELLERATATEPRHRPSAEELAAALVRGPDPSDGHRRSVYGEVRRRRMLPIVGAYLAAGVAGMSGVDQLVQQAILPALAYRVALAFFIAGLNAAIIVAWFHGAKGRQRVSRAEVALLSLVVVAWLVATVLMVL